MKGISLHIGINVVDPNHYGGWDGKLSACEYDAGKMEAIAKAEGYDTHALLSADATRHRVTESILQAANALGPGDIFLLSYSGHGSQKPDQNGDEPDFLDETWCLYDGELLDDEIYQLWSSFKEDVRVLVLSDSCHSGTIIRSSPSFSGACKVSDTSRNAPDSVAVNTYLSNKAFYDEILSKTPTKSEADIKASIRLISGCQDNQYSYENAFGGYFSTAVADVWNGGKFRGNYEKFHKRILSRLPDYQSPNHLVLGKRIPGFDKSKPFSIKP